MGDPRRSFPGAIVSKLSFIVSNMYWQCHARRLRLWFIIFQAQDTCWSGSVLGSVEWEGDFECNLFFQHVVDVEFVETNSILKKFLTVNGDGTSLEFLCTLLMEAQFIKRIDMEIFGTKMIY